ncbi:MAG: YraN family protein [Candidatus Omnitrophota bacterium]
MNTRITGNLGEEAAVKLLKEKKYTILERNYRNRLGEVDIIAKDKDVICFVEVKTRLSDVPDLALEAVSTAKQKKIAQTALSYLKQHHLLDEEARFDVVIVTQKRPSILSAEIIQDAFSLPSPYRY